MKNTKSKVLLVLFVLCSVLILFSSCQKKAQTSQTTTAEVKESTAVKTETKTAETVVKAEEPVQAAKTEETVQEAKAEEPAVVAQSIVETKTEETVAVETEAASPAAVDESVYSDTLTYKGFNTTIVVDNTKSSITLPGGVGLEEVEAVAGLINSAYPAEASLVSYELDDDTLVLTYPEQSDEFLLAVVDTLRSQAMELLDSYVVKSVEETTVTVADVTAGKTETEAAAESKPVYSDTLSYRGLNASVAVYSDNAMIKVPAGIDYDDISYVAEMVAGAYPAESSLVYFDYKDGVLSLTYPEQTDEFLLAVVDVLREEAMALLDKAAPSVLPSEKTETVKAEEKNAAEAENAAVITEAAKASEDSVLFTVTFSYNGYKSDITVTNTRAEITIPEGISSEDIAFVAKNVADRYPDEAALITYSVENGKLVLSYPEQSGDYLRASLEYVEKEAKAILDLYPIHSEAPAETAVAAVPAQETAPAVEAPAAKAESAETKTEAPVEAAPAEETKTAAAPAAEEDTKASLPQMVEAVSPVTEPVLAEKTSAFTGFSVAAVAVPKFNLAGGWTSASPFVLGFGIKAEAGFGSFGIGLKAQYDMSAYLLTSVYGRYTIVSLDKLDLYALLGAGASFGVGPNRGQYAFLLEAGVGVDYFITEKFSVFGEVNGQYSIKKPGFELGLTVGGKYTF